MRYVWLGWLAVALLLSGCAHDLSIGYGVSAKEYFEKGDYDKVIEQAKQGIDHDASNGAAWYWLGEGYVHKGRYAEAIPAFQNALKLLPDTPVWGITIKNCDYWLGYSFYITGSYDEAIASLTRAIERDPRYWSALQWRGWASYKKGNLAAALADFNTTLSLEPNSAAALHGRGWVYYFQGNFDAAKRDFDSASRLIPADDKADAQSILIGKAFSYLGLGDSETADNLIKKANQVSGYPGYAYHLSLIHYVAGDTEKAWEYRGGKGMIGVAVKDYKNGTLTGAEVSSIVAGSPAEKSGMLPGDVIIGLNGAPVTGLMDFVAKARALTPDTSAKVRLLREGMERELPLHVGMATGQMESDPLIAPIVAKRKTVSATVAAASPTTAPPAAASDVDELPPRKVTPNRNAYAVVIGIEHYRQKLPNADFANHDAQTVAEYLTKVMGYPEENVVTLLNEHATNVDLAKYLEKWLPDNVEKGGTVFVYYSGHGAPNPRTGDAYLVPYDGDPTFIEQTGYPLEKLYADLGRLPAQEVIVALDSCFSGAGGKSVIARGARPLVMNLRNTPLPSGNMTVMTASSGEQISSVYEEKGHGLFTYFMLKGIKNETVTKPDGSLRFADLFGYLRPQVERIARKRYNNEQTPQLIEPRK